MSGRFEDARFGLFVHWGPWAAMGLEASWPLVGGLPDLGLTQSVPAEAYHAAADRWRPDPEAPARWVEAAVRAGMRYAVLTARHHDGYALWPSAAGGAGVGPNGPDVVGAFVAACRARGLKVGLYYSLPDWRHPDYPAFTNSLRPYRFGAYPWPGGDVWARYLTYLERQVVELVDRYRPDLLWFDGGWERTAEQWRAADLARRIRSLHPGILLNDRLPGQGDFATPEQFIPPEPPDGPWEVCLTMNRSWGFNPHDQDYKSATHLVHLLAETAGSGGNLLLNVSPDGAGEIPPPQRARLEAMGAWVHAHGEALFGTRPGLAAWQFRGPSTRRGETLFLFLTMQPVDLVPVRGVPVARLRAVRHLPTGQALSFEVRRPVVDRILGVDGPGEVWIAVPWEGRDPHATVLALELVPGP